MMEVGMAFERKDFEYKVVAKVPHESKEDTFAYMVAQREFGSQDVTYYTTEMEFGKGFKQTEWLGV